MLGHYAILWYVTLQTNSSTFIALFSIALALPTFFISPFGGVWADRYNRKLLINLSDGGIAAVTLLMALLYANGVTSVWLLFICIIVRSVGQGIQTPAVTSLIPQIVPEENLAKFNGLHGTVHSIVMLVSPMAGGAVLSLAPIHILMFIDVVTAIIGIVMLVFTVTVPNLVGAEFWGKSYFEDIKSGLSYIKSNKMLFSFFIFNIFFNLLIVPLSVMTPLHVARTWGDAYWMLTVNESIFCVGMMLGEVGRVPIGTLLIITGALILISSPFFVMSKAMREAGAPIKSE
jgi:DHA3 family macrolide efflux protein-like MFS transporter